MKILINGLTIMKMDLKKKYVNYLRNIQDTYHITNLKIQLKKTVMRLLNYIKIKI